MNDSTQTETSTCQWCDEPILDFEPHETYLGGQKAHVECALRSIVGGVNHQRGLCSCCGGTLPADPPNTTRREAATLAWREFHSNQRPKESP